MPKLRPGQFGEPYAQSGEPDVEDYYLRDYS